MDPYRGMGVVQTILVDLDATRASAEWNRNFFLNSAEPGGIVEVDRRLTTRSSTSSATGGRSSTAACERPPGRHAGERPDVGRPQVLDAGHGVHRTAQREPGDHP
jgi:hypothetical protein